MDDTQKVSDLAAFASARLDEDGLPPRVIEALRAIVAIHVPDEDGDCFVCITERNGYQEQWAWDAWPCQTLRRVAAIWNYHPDYRQEWKP